MWSENIDIIERVFLNLTNSPNKDTFKTLMCVSTLYRQIGEHILSKNTHTFGCKCKCDEMIKYKISDAVKSWKCANCDHRIAWNSWKRSDYQTLKKDVCKKCFKNHWLGTLIRRKSLLITTN